MLVICIEEDKEKLKTLEQKLEEVTEGGRTIGFSDEGEALKWMWDNYSGEVLADVRTFGNFDVFVHGKTVEFRRSKAKELLAYLIDRKGGGVTRAEAFTILWDKGIYDRSMQKQLDVIIRSLRSTLEEYGIGDILEIRGGVLRVRTEHLNCDLYNFQNGDPVARAAYRGEYMSSYSWGNQTEAYMTRSMDK